MGTVGGASMTCEHENIRFVRKRSDVHLQGMCMDCKGSFQTFKFEDGSFSPWEDCPDPLPPEALPSEDGIYFDIDPPARLLSATAPLRKAPSISHASKEELSKLEAVINSQRETIIRLNKDMNKLQWEERYRFSPFAAAFLYTFPPAVFILAGILAGIVFLPTPLWGKILTDIVWIAMWNYAFYKVCQFVQDAVKFNRKESYISKYPE